MAVFGWNIVVSLRHGAAAGDNPWNAWTLEWATTSPPPLAQLRPAAAGPQPPPALGRRAPGEPGLGAQAAQRGAGDTQEIRVDKNIQGTALFLASEAVFFVLLILAFVYYHKNLFNESTGSPPNPGRVLDPAKTGIYTACLLASSVTIWRAGRGLKRGNQAMVRALACSRPSCSARSSCSGRGSEYARLIGENVTVSRNLFGSTFFTLTGFHGFHVFMGLVAITILLGLAVGGLVQGAALRRAGGGLALLALRRCRLGRHLLDDLSLGARMTTGHLLATAWDWEPSVLLGCTALIAAYVAATRRRPSRAFVVFLRGRCWCCSSRHARRSMRWATPISSARTWCSISCCC